MPSDDSPHDQAIESQGGSQPPFISFSSHSSAAMPLATQRPYEVTQRALTASAEMSIPVQHLLQPNNAVIGLLSGLSVQELATMEATLHQAKMVRMQSVALNAANTSMTEPSPDQEPSLLPAKHAASRSTTKGVFSVMNPTRRVPQPSTPPTLQVDENGTWLNFSYSSKSVHQTYKIRADVDTVLENDIALNLRQSNCLYPSANGPKQEYKGSRLGYERECNTQGWKLVHLNPDLLTGKRGLLQQAVISLRNATSDQKSRRARRKEKSKVETPRPPIRLPEPELSTAPLQPVSSGDGLAVPSVHKQTRQLSWQLPLTPGSPRPTQRPTRMARPSALDLVGSSVSEHTVDLSPSRPARTEEEQWRLRLPTLGSFSPVTELGLLLDFEGYDQGRFKNLTILCDVNRVQLDDLSLEFKRANCVYPRSFLTERTGLDQWNTSGVKQAEESYLNELGWRLCSLNRPLLDGKRLLLQQALDAYRRKFLPLTCHPRARIGASLMTRRNSATLHSLGNHPSEPHRRKSKPHVHFDFDDVPLSHSTRTWTEGHFGDMALFGDENETDAQEDEDGMDETDDMESEEEDGEESEELADIDGHSDDDDDGSSSEGEGSLYGNEFHSQMSLLTFTGSIQTYSLGTGSGSARSRPRLNPSDLSSMTSPSLPSHDPPRHSSKKKRGFEDPLFEHSYGHDGTALSPDKMEKRRKNADISGPGKADQSIEIGGNKDDEADAEEKGEGEVEVEERFIGGTSAEMETETEDESTTGSYNEQDDEDNWWKSRLDNSEYPEDHDFVSMTTEELIGALTSGYVDDYDDDDDDDEDVGL